MSPTIKKARISVKEEMDFPDTTNVSHLDLASFSRGSSLKDGPNEDSLMSMAVEDSSVVLAIADGLGGQNAGDVASQKALRALANTITTEPNPDVDDLRYVILNGIEKANKAVQFMNNGAGTTLSVVEVVDQKFRPYHVGDSSTLVVGNRGKIKFQSIPHSPVGFALEAGLITEEEAMYHDQRHIVTNVVGTPEMRIDVGPKITLKDRDTILIASDGLTDNVHLDEIVEIIRKGSLEEAANNLAELCLSRMEYPEDDQPSKPDDTTFILCRLSKKSSKSKSKK